MDKVRETITDMKQRAAAKGRAIKFGYRVHVVVRETEEEARAYADRLLSKLDEEAGKAIREKSLDAKNFGVQRQQELRGAAGSDGAGGMVGRALAPAIRYAGSRHVLPYILPHILNFAIP
jgi:alkanesulfonate monooxygenase